MRDSAFGRAGLVMLLGFLLAVDARGSAPERPNVIFVLADDLGWRDLGSFGSTFHETPNLDRLAAEGMRFTQAYAACPVCHGEMERPLELMSIDAQLNDLFAS